MSMRITFVLLACIMNCGIILSNTQHPLIAIISVPEFNQEGSYAYTKVKVGATYVRWLEASGADSLVLHPSMNDDSIKDYLSKIDGILLQDEEFDITSDNPYIQFVTKVFNIWLENVKQEKNRVPIFGIDHGFLTLQYLISQNDNIFSDAEAYIQNLSLIFDEDRIKTTRLFSHFYEKDIKSLTFPITSHYHVKGVHPSAYEKNENLRNFFRITTMAKDTKNRYFISSIESFNYPVYGIAFHPDYVFIKDLLVNDDNTPETIRVSRALANFFVDEARKSKNSGKILPEDLSKYNYIDQYKVFPEKRDSFYFYYFDIEPVPTPPVVSPRI